MTPDPGHRADVEGLRAIAIGLVLLYHGRVEAFGGGFIGVDVFFVISGFLITRSLIGELERRGSIGLGAFYARRVRRLLPAAALMLATTALATRALLPPTLWRDFGGDIAAAAAYAVNWRLALRSVDYLAQDLAASPVQHCWSLAIEEQFYLVWPVLLLLAAAIARGRAKPLRPVSIAVLATLVVAPSLAWWAVRTASRPELAFFDTGARMWELAAGGLVALSRPGRMLPARWRTLLKATAVAILVALGMAVDDSPRWRGVAALAAVGPTALLLSLGGLGDDLVERALSRRPLQRIGAWSYSLYLWHWPPLALLAARWGALSTAQALAIVALSTVPAVLSYTLVENPIRFAPALRASTPLSLSLGANLSLLGLLAGLTIALSMPRDAETRAAALQPDGRQMRGAAVGAAVLSPRPLGSFSDAEVLASLTTVAAITPAPTLATNDRPRAENDHCLVDAHTSVPRVCRYGDPSGRIHVALVGDSKAGQWGDALESIGVRHGWRLTYLLKSACELSTSLAEAQQAPDPICRAWGESVLGLLAADPPDLVLTSQVSSTAWADGSDATKREVLVEGMLEAYGRLRARGSAVAILIDNPNPGRLKVDDCVSQHPDDLASCTFARDPGSGGRPAQLAAAERGGYAVIDLADRICPGATCPPVIGNVLVYRQGSHLTRTYVSTLSDALEQRLVPLVESAARSDARNVARRDGEPTLRDSPTVSRTD
ncbi:MAG TPA: acyltransferase family protein [Myxococcota bacterium]|nr:acyltransferase family protein [Myxococcota bacterium]